MFRKLFQKRMVKFCFTKNLFILLKTNSPDTDKKILFRCHSFNTEIMRPEIDINATRQSCFIDLQKAFDTPYHSILLEKLERYSYRGPVLPIIKTYLSDRWQHIDIKGTYTDTKKILTGVSPGFNTWTVSFFCCTWTTLMPVVVIAK